MNEAKEFVLSLPWARCRECGRVDATVTWDEMPYLERVFCDASCYYRWRGLSA